MMMGGGPAMGGPGMGGMMGPGGMMPAGGGMHTPGYGAMGMPGSMATGMGGMGGPLGAMNPMMGQMGQMGQMGGGIMGGGMMHPMMGQMGGGMNPMLMQGGYGNPNNEAQAMPVSVMTTIPGRWLTRRGCIRTTGEHNRESRTAPCRLIRWATRLSPAVPAEAGTPTVSLDSTSMTDRASDRLSGVGAGGNEERSS